MKARMTRTRGSGPVANRTGNTVKLMMSRKNRIKFTESQVTRAGSGLNGWFREKWLLETIMHRNCVNTGR